MYPPRPDLASFRDILGADPVDQVALLPLIVDKTDELLNDRSWYGSQIGNALLSHMLRRKPVTEQGGLPRRDTRIEPLLQKLW